MPWNGSWNEHRPHLCALGAFRADSWDVGAGRACGAAQQSTLNPPVRGRRRHMRTRGPGARQGPQSRGERIWGARDQGVDDQGSRQQLVGPRPAGPRLSFARHRRAPAATPSASSLPGCRIRCTDSDPLSRGASRRAIPRANVDRRQATASPTEPLLGLLKCPVSPARRCPATPGMRLGQGVAGSNPAVPTGSGNFSNIFVPQESPQKSQSRCVTAP
jgi:hypothetical protein